MSPDDVKKWLDLLVVLIGSGGVGTIILAFIGFWKAKAERPTPPAASVGSNGMAQIAGMVMGQQQASDIVMALQANAASSSAQAMAISAQTLVIEGYGRLMRELSDIRHSEMRKLNDHLDTLGDRLKDIPGR